MAETKPEYKIGQEITIVKTAREGRFYHGGTVGDVPLGSKGIIEDFYGDEIQVRLNRTPSSIWYLHPDEIKPIELKVKDGFESSASLDGLLLGTTPEMQKIESKIGILARIKNYFVKRKESKIEKDEGVKFNPKFNVREEFAIWVRQEFPELQNYSKSRKKYRELEARKDEVMQAAIGVMQHGEQSTEACASSRLVSGWYVFNREFKKEKGRLAKGLEALVKSVEDLSISLGGDNHYTQAGKFLDGTSYGVGALDAFIYRIGEDGKEARYLVFDNKQEFEGENKPVLIGELISLTEEKLARLKEFVPTFIGPESDFIREVDARVPESGDYGYYPYSGAYTRTGNFRGRENLFSTVEKVGTSYLERNPYVHLSVSPDLAESLRTVKEGDDIQIDLKSEEEKF